MMTLNLVPTSSHAAIGPWPDLGVTSDCISSGLAQLTVSRDVLLALPETEV